MQNPLFVRHARAIILSATILGTCLFGLSPLEAQMDPMGVSTSTSTSSTVPAETSTTITMTTTTTLATMSPQGGGSFLAGTWKVERAIFELFGNLKEVTNSDERFYSQLVLNPNMKGSLVYATRPENVDIEYDIKNNQNLTIAHGSRLKPLVDLYQVLLLSDGSIFLRSSRLSMLNGTVYYLLRRVP